MLNDMLPMILQIGTLTLVPPLIWNHPLLILIRLPLMQAMSMWFFGNGNTSYISHIGKSLISRDLELSNVLVVPNLPKNLLSINKLKKESLVDILFSNLFYTIQNRATKEILARGI